MRTYFMQIEREIPEWPSRNEEESTTTFSEEPLKPHYTVWLETKHKGKVYRSDCSSQISMKKARKNAEKWLLQKLNI